jgi:ComF family protein
MRPQMGIHAVAIYDGVIRSAIHRFKFQKKKKLAQALGIVMVRYLSRVSSLNVKEIDFIVPVPLHKRRAKQRGFNQADLLAGMVSKYYEVPSANALERVRDTHPQFDLPREKRLTNVKGVFKVSEPKAVYNKNILLLDDIYTTGSTIFECTKALKVAGAKRVEVLTLARAVEI